MTARELIDKYASFGRELGVFHFDVLEARALASVAKALIDQRDGYLKDLDLKEVFRERFNRKDNAELDRIANGEEK